MGDHMRYTALLLAALTVATGANADERFEAYLDGLVAAQFNDYDLAGMTFVMVQDQQISLLKGYGLADLASSTPVDPATSLFRPGSVSKLFTWTAVMQLVEQGKLDLNTPVQTYVDQFEIPNEMGEPITLAHILSHAPGLEDGAAGYLFADKLEDNIPLAEALAKYKPVQVRAPGTSSAYSNWATALAGLIVANVSGQSFESYVRDRILSPLGMRYATFEEPLPEDIAQAMATGYVEEKNTLVPFGFEYIKNFGPAGAMSASSGALARFMLAHLNEGAIDGARILQSDTVATMHSNLFAHSDNAAAMAHGFIELRRHGHRFIGHGGDTIAFHSEMILDPVRKWGMFVSFNTPDGAAARSAIVNGVIDYFYAVNPPQWNFEPLDGSEARLAEVAGAYRINRRSYTKLEALVGLAGDLPIAPADSDLKSGRILIPGDNIGGQFAEVRPYVYRRVGGTGEVEFLKDAEGNVDRMLLLGVPVIVADKLRPLEMASTHQIVLLLAVLASLFVLINSVRNRRVELQGAARQGRRLVTSAAVFNLLFALAVGLTIAGLDMNRVVFDFPPTSLAIALVLPILSLLATAGALIYLPGVWRSAECTPWARLRYTYVVVLFLAQAGVFYYWNMIGWNYY